MTGWVPKRFWTSATVEPEGAGFAVRLDGRAVRTPAKAALVLPTRAMAEDIAAARTAEGARGVLFGPGCVIRHPCDLGVLGTVAAMLRQEV